MWRALFVVAVLASALACPPRKSPEPPIVVDERPLLVEIAGAEGRRGDGVARLLELADHDAPAVRAAALRGLARVGTAEAIARLIAEVEDGADPVAAATALGLAASLEPLEPEVAATVTTALLGLLARAGEDGAAPVIEALGRAGDLSALPAIATALGEVDPRVAAAGGIALGRFGRRSLVADEATFAAAIAATRSADRDVRFAATYGLTNGHVPPAEGTTAPLADEAAAALAARIGDDDAEIRAYALAGLAKRKARAAAGTAPLDALRDLDWRVAVVAVRLLAAPGARADDVQAVAAHAAREWARLATGDAGPSTAHVVMEALRALADDAGDAGVREAIDSIADSLIERLPRERPEEQRLAAAHIKALAFAALAHPGPPGEGGYTPAAALVILEGTADLSDDVVGALVASALTAQLATVPEALLGLIERAERLQAIGRRAPVIGELPGAWPKADADSRSRIVAALAVSLASSAPELAGTAADAAAAVLLAVEAEAALPPPPPPPPGEIPPVPAGDGGAAALEAALVARIDSAADDPELTSSLLAAAGTAKIAAALEPCRAAHVAANPAVRLAGRTCLTALTGADPGPGVSSAAATTPAEADPAVVIGHEVVWTVETTRGTVTIRLDPALAAWHVATIVALTRRGFYDGLRFHRVVPGFVVQGGDPSGTGWGGPGFTLPSEPSSAPYDTGTVGIADAGKDTGGSQWFAMHETAPHLAARYTVIGQVQDGQPVIDQLLVGDLIVHATVTVSP